ncbi:hypothetical protein KFL_012520010 [Klebsormidium nitens]|uniref:Uncharacterized protein n=1 Tax=Klebsormidium nitens TaxID=105231 RepID=A0A1Y1IWB0_KLENI|nr:hypothetical protein KFL_012520010 [Klebsormidium nitens]|eukprot:GAQ93017.1 hypothetical protein KFL_012520010 [Klebsormidium nitens]
MFGSRIVLFSRGDGIVTFTIEPHETHKEARVCFASPLAGEVAPELIFAHCGLRMSIELRRAWELVVVCYQPWVRNAKALLPEELLARGVCGGLQQGSTQRRLQGRVRLPRPMESEEARRPRVSFARRLRRWAATRIGWRYSASATCTRSHACDSQVRRVRPRRREVQRWGHRRGRLGLVKGRPPVIPGLFVGALEEQIPRDKFEPTDLPKGIIADALSDSRFAELWSRLHGPTRDAPRTYESPCLTGPARVKRYDMPWLLEYKCWKVPGAARPWECVARRPPQAEEQNLDSTFTHSPSVQPRASAPALVASPDPLSPDSIHGRQYSADDDLGQEVSLDKVLAQHVRGRHLSGAYYPPVRSSDPSPVLDAERLAAPPLSSASTPPAHSACVSGPYRPPDLFTQCTDLVPPTHPGGRMGYGCWPSTCANGPRPPMQTAPTTLAAFWASRDWETGLRLLHQHIQVRVGQVKSGTRAGLQRNSSRTSERFGGGVCRQPAMSDARQEAPLRGPIHSARQRLSWQLQPGRSPPGDAVRGHKQTVEERTPGLGPLTTRPLLGRVDSTTGEASGACQSSRRRSGSRTSGTDGGGVWTDPP